MTNRSVCLAIEPGLVIRVANETHMRARVAVTMDFRSNKSNTVCFTRIEKRFLC